MLVESGGKKFEKPSPGMWLARIIDVVELGLVVPKNPMYKTKQRHEFFG